MTIQTCDLSDYTSCDTSLRSRAIGTLGEALVETGFVIVEGHAIDERLCGEVYAGWRRFFALDEAVKRQYAGSDGGARGFTPFGVEHAKDNPTPDLKEFWHVGPEEAAGQALRYEYPPNLWPSEVPGLRQPTMALFHELERVAELLLLALAEHFALPEETFAAMARQGNSVLRVLHYPALAPAASTAQSPAAPAPPGGAAPALRAAAHEDINLITLLCGATDAGLELLSRDGEWLPVEASPGQIVVDAGDMLSRVTNQVIPAATHRVVNPPVAPPTPAIPPAPGTPPTPPTSPSAGTGAGERYSMPFFVHPYPACDLSVLERFVSPQRPRRFPPITAGELLESRLREIGLKR
jgi:isopenicillin N synthase-like dioxygenase